MSRKRDHRGFANPSSRGDGVAIYLRVSTVRQQKGEVSIPSQRKACQGYCKTNGKVVVAEFVDGASGTDDARPEFRRMIDAAEQPDCAFDTIIVHSLSRFYRSGPEMEILIRRLNRRGVHVTSVTQPIGNDPAQTMLRQVIGIFDEYTSLENGKNVRRSMRENAKQGFWNGTTPPLGYRVVAVEERGGRIKKKLEVDPDNAAIVRTIFDLYLDGPPGAGPLGVKNVVKVLNERGLRTRRGALFGVGPVHKILTAEHYTSGVYRWGVTSAKTGERNPVEDVVEIGIPSLISRETFARAKEKLAANHRSETPPRVVNGPCLLIGLAVCGTCGSGMTRTGTIRRDRRYSYYTCAGCHQKGPTACRGRHIPMEKLDELVVGALKARLLAPERLALLLQALVDREARETADASDRLISHQVAADDARMRLQRLYEKIASGVFLEEDDVLTEIIAKARSDLEKATAALSRARLQAAPSTAIDAERITRFVRLMSERLDEADVNARRGFISSVVNAIEVHDDRICIMGQPDTLSRAVRGQIGTEKVRGFVRKWRTREDSNL